MCMRYFGEPRGEYRYGFYPVAALKGWEYKQHEAGEVGVEFFIEVAIEG